jgi:hypothetical protein
LNKTIDEGRNGCSNNVGDVGGRERDRVREGVRMRDG